MDWKIPAPRIRVCTICAMKKAIAKIRASRRKMYFPVTYRDSQNAGILAMAR